MFISKPNIFTSWLFWIRYVYLNQNSQAVKKECGPQKGQDEKRCEIQGGGQEMDGCDGRLMAKILITTIQVNLRCLLH